MMEAVNRWMAVFSLALCACGSPEGPLPSGVSVAPPSMATNERILLSIDPITTQVREKKFTIRIRVAGPDAELFQGRVKLSTSRGSITPPLSTVPFSQGLCLQEVSLDDAGGNNVTITVEDYAGHSFT